MPLSYLFLSVFAGLWIQVETPERVPRGAQVPAGCGSATGSAPFLLISVSPSCPPSLLLIRSRTPGPASYHGGDVPCLQAGVPVFGWAGGATEEPRTPRAVTVGGEVGWGLQGPPLPPPQLRRGRAGASLRCLRGASAHLKPVLIIKVPKVSNWQMSHRIQRAPGRRRRLAASEPAAPHCREGEGGHGQLELGVRVAWACTDVPFVAPLTPVLPLGMSWP